MTRENVFEKLNEVFRDVFDDEEIVLTEETTSEDIEDWDSLEHINLIVAVEQCFGIKFSRAAVDNQNFHDVSPPICFFYVILLLLSQ